jgi:hypothetical protein
VLFEASSKGWWEGHADKYMKVAVKTNRPLKNVLARVKITGLDGERVTGKIF